ncbi:MAG: hypothetical protein ACI9RV_001093, partial [Glaciecola sp.]
YERLFNNNKYNDNSSLYLEIKQKIVAPLNTSINNIRQICCHMKKLQLVAAFDISLRTI